MRNKNNTEYINVNANVHRHANKKVTVNVSVNVSIHVTINMTQVRVSIQNGWKRAQDTERKHADRRS